MVSDKWLRDVPLAPRTTWRIGGPAKFFFAPETPDEAVEACKALGRALA